jgi:hypothetical protein
VDSPPHCVSVQKTRSPSSERRASAPWREGRRKAAMETVAAMGSVESSKTQEDDFAAWVAVHDAPPFVTLKLEVRRKSV